MSDILECVEAVKTCSKCGETKPISEFVRGTNQCRNCKNEKMKAYRDDPEVKERLRAKRKAYRDDPEIKKQIQVRQKAYRNDPKVRERILLQQRTNKSLYIKQTHGRAIQMLIGARKRAKDKGIPFDLTPEWLEPKIDAGVCEMTGISFDMGKPPEGKVTNPYAPSIDQIIPSAGYTMDNCRLVTWAYNKDKGDGTDRETLGRYKTVLEYNGNVVVSTRNPFGLLVKILNLHSFKPKD